MQTAKSRDVFDRNTYMNVCNKRVEAIASVGAFAHSESYEVKIGRLVKIYKEVEVKSIHLFCAHGKKPIFKETLI